MIKSKNNISVGLKKIENSKIKPLVYLDNKTNTLSSRSVHKNNWLEKPVHAYLLGKETPKLGEWVFDDEYFLNSKMEQDWDSVLVYKTDEEYYRIGKEARKIIATTDPEILYEIASLESLNFFIPAELSKHQLKEIIEIFNK